MTADVVKITTLPSPKYTLDFGDQRRRLLVVFSRQQLEGDDLVRLAKEDVSFQYEIGSRIQFPRSWFSLGWFGNDATSEAARWIGEGDDLTFDGQFLLGEVVSHEFDRTGGTRVKYYYGIRFLLQHRQRPTTLSTMAPPPSSVTVGDIPRADIESAASGIPRTTQSLSSSSSSSSSPSETS